MKLLSRTYNDEEILSRIRRGDEGALDYLYAKYYRMMLNLVLKNNGTEDEAKDVFQDALIVFWQKAVSNELVLTSKISTFLYSICQNLWRKELERKKRLSNEEKEDSEEQSFIPNEKYLLIHKCLDKLGETCKQILQYYYFEELSMQDIAEKMGFSNADTAKTKKYKCKKELDILVKKMYKEEDFLD